MIYTVKSKVDSCAVVEHNGKKTAMLLSHLNTLEKQGHTVVWPCAEKKKEEVVAPAIEKHILCTDHECSDCDHDHCIDCDCVPCPNEDKDCKPCKCDDEFCKETD